MKNIYKAIATIAIIFVSFSAISQTVFEADKYKKVLYRINAGNLAKTTNDGTGVHWLRDDYTVPSEYSNYEETDNKIYTTTEAITFHSSVPDDYPEDLFHQERSIYGWDVKRMEWKFPVEEGTKVTVRVFMAEIFHHTADDRRFNIELEGRLVEEGIDLFKDYGRNVAVMKTYDAVSDGIIDLAFITVKGQPTVAAIELFERNEITGLVSMNKTGNNSMVYPNPFTSQLSVVKNTGSTNELPSLFNLHGQLIHDMNIYDQGDHYSIEAPNLPKGTYIIRTGTQAQLVEKH